MVTRRVAVLAGFLLFTLQFSRTTFASPPQPCPPRQPKTISNFTLEGKITEKSAGKLTVSSGENMIFHVALQRQNGNQEKGRQPWHRPQDLHTGLKISVAGDLAESGEITAKKIAIEGEGSEKQ